MSRARAVNHHVPTHQARDESDGPSLARTHARPHGGAEARTSHSDGQTLTVRIPFRIMPRGGRKLVIGSTGPESLPRLERVDSAVVKALARAFRWRKLIESGVYDSVDQIARAEKINASYVSRIIRMTLIAPQVVEAIMDGRHEALQLDDMMRPMPIDWTAQGRKFAASSQSSAHC